jgi:hypothetical protein
MTLLDQKDFRVIKGEKSPMSGWFSPSYGFKCETSVLSISITGTPEESTLTTGIGIDRPFDLRDITARLNEIE